MKILAHLIVAFLLLSATLQAQQPTDFNQLWNEIDLLKKQGLPQSAIKLTDKVYAMAKQEGNEAQQIKALIYKISLQGDFQEEHMLTALQELKTEIKQAQTPGKEILNSLLAQLLQHYYTQNRWQILQRTPIAGNPPADIQTWDAMQFEQSIQKHYQLSLQNQQQLEAVSLSDFNDILSDYNTKAWPTLYDLLANRALRYFSESPVAFSQISEPRFLQSTPLFAPVNEFIGLPIDAKSYGENQAKVLVLFQRLLAFHAKSDDKEALVDLDLRRLAYVYEHSVQSEVIDSKYKQSLAEIIQNNAQSPSLNKVYYTLALFYYQSDYETDTSKKLNLVKAVEISNRAINLYPDSTQSAPFKALLSGIQQTLFTFTTEEVLLPDQPVLATLKYKNTSKLYFRVVRQHANDFLLNQRHNHESLKKLTEKTGVITFSQELPDNQDYQFNDVLMDIPALKTGLYMLFISDQPDFGDEATVVYHQFQVSSLSYLSKDNNASGINELFVLDRESGKPIAGADIQVYQNRYNNKQRSYEFVHVGQLLANKEGYTAVSAFKNENYGNYSFVISKNGDTLFSDQYLRFYKVEKYAEPSIKTYLFTDRAIYRPGQTIFYKGIAVSCADNNCKLVTNQSDLLQVYSPNGKKILEFPVVTDMNGSFQGSFTVPSDQLNGQMNLRVKSGNASFLVEEYKRPNFFVKFQPDSGQYRLLDSIPVSAKVENYAGNPVTNASVSYRVTRTSFSPIPYRNRVWFPPYQSVDYPIAYGQTVTNSAGVFCVKFEAAADVPVNNDQYQFYHYTVNVQVTDITGEVHAYSHAVKIGSVSVLLNISAPQQINLDSPDGFRISANNLSDVGLKMPVKLMFYQLKTPDKLLFSNPFSDVDKSLMSEQVFHEKFPNTDWKGENNPENWAKTEMLSQQYQIDGYQLIVVEELKSWSSGEYVVVAEGLDDHGEKVSFEHYFSLYSDKKNSLPAQTPFWVANPARTIEPGQNLMFSLGSSDKKAKILVEVTRGDEVILSEWINSAGKIKMIEIPVLEAYRGGFQVTATMVLNNHLFSQTYFVHVPFTNKKLDITLETRRDFLTPGEKETWSIRVSDANGNPLAANLVAGMYDASLDQFATNSWNMSLYKPAKHAAGWVGVLFHAEYSSPLQVQKTLPFTGYYSIYPDLNWFGYLHSGHGLLYEKSAAGRSEVLGLAENVETLDYEVVPVAEQVSSPEKEPENIEIPLRENFSETAFFYPDLFTDNEGRAIFSFDTPDALTTWKLMMLAYTDDLKTGADIQEFKAKKSLMVMPNVPRFVRQGDLLDFTAKVVNMSEEDSKITVEIEFFDPLTGNVLDLSVQNPESTSVLSILKGQSAAFSSQIQIPFDLLMLGIRTTATDGVHSDGEEHVIPVLTNRVLVTETMPMNVKAFQDKTFEFTNLINTGRMMRQTSAQNLRFTVEFTSNPAWYAIQALPSMSEPISNSTLSVFNRYQANALSAFILNSNPLIKQVFESWKNHSPDAFLSNLQKNEKLKSALLQASPWILEAESEADQKQRIALLFNLNQLSHDKEKTMEKLAATQLQSGAWPWFNGMRDDRYTTQSILLGLAKLDHKGVLTLSADRARLAMVEKALRWLDAEVEADYNEIIKRYSKTSDKNHLSATNIQYLYTRSLLMELFPMPSSSKKAIDYFVGQARKYWLVQNNYLQAMLALALPEFGYRNDSEAILRSLTERALLSDELGMYWRQDKGWNWYEAPVETQSMLIEAFSQLQKNISIVDQMKVWLLKQKQTSKWATSAATAEAVYALLMTGGNLLEENKLVDLTVGGVSLNDNPTTSTSLEAGTGYFSRSWAQTEIRPEMGEIAVKNPNNHIAWGAAYWQYFENMDKVIAKQTTLSVEKKLFVETATDTGRVLVPTPKPQVVKLGDKLVVRLVVTTDRDLEFVHLSDTRVTGFEPVSNLSGYTWSGGLGFYRQVTDTGTDFFIRYMPKGTFVLEYELFVTQRGTFIDGIATIQSMYAPEFAAHSFGSKVKAE